MPSLTPLQRSRPLRWSLAAVGAAALFAAGAFTARALDDEPAPASPGSGLASDLPGGSGPAVAPGSSRPASPVSTARGGTPAEDAVPAKVGYGWPAGCPAVLPADTFGAAAIDLPSAGLTPHVPRSGFELLNVSLSATSDCGPDGQPTGPARPVLSSSWRHTATGLEVYITQQPSSDPLAPLRRPDGAAFAALGFRFDVYVNAYPVVPVDQPKPDLGVPKPDPRAADVLDEVISQIAPGLDRQCFWTIAEGTWDDVLAAGIGDPRPAVPSGLTLAELHVSAFREPAPGCDTSIRPSDGFGVFASWNGQAGDSLGISVTALPAGSETPFPGYIDQYSAGWQRGNLQFSVWYSGSKKSPDSESVIRAIAKALDPSFDDACFVRQQTLSEADLSRLGLRAPAPPPGYTIVSANLTASDVAQGCARPDGFVASYSLSWTLEKGADVIEANAFGSSGKSTDGSFYGSISDYSINWVTTEGTSYSVNGYSKGINPAVPRDDLIAVALSLDPNLDISRLEAADTGGGAVPPRPAPERTN